MNKLTIAKLGLLLSLEVVLFSCVIHRSQQSTDAVGEATGEAAIMAEPSKSPVKASELASRSEARRLEQELAAHLKANKGLTHQALLEQHHPPFLEEHGLEVEEAEYYDLFVKAFNLTDGERQVLGDRGFVVVTPPGLRAPTKGGRPATGPADVYYRIFAADLPVFVSADSILHAWHRSYDSILEQSELALMIPALMSVLDQTIGALDEQTQAGRDALLYLAVARSLLDEEWEVPASVAQQLRPILTLAAERRASEITFLGETVEFDFSQLTPRGHYARSLWPQMRSYFQAMQWLGRFDLVLYDSEIGGPRNPREEAAARALVSAMTHLEEGRSAVEAYRELDSFYRIHVGRPSALSPIDLSELCAQAGERRCNSDSGTLAAIYQAQGGAAYSSRLHGRDRGTLSMRFFPQRFGFDAWITARTTTPELQPNVRGGRSMASPLDVAFALGNDRAAAHLSDEMDLPYREELPATLEALRQTVATVPPTSIDDTIYNRWLEALMVYSQPLIDERFPRVLRTSAWHDRQLEAVLGSWTELRHDTILVVEQSMGGAGCQYPRGYVEPVPALYRQLAETASRLTSAYGSERSLPDVLDTVPAFVAHFRQVMERLATLAELELAGEEMSDDDLAFLNRTVDQHRLGYGGVRSYDGWYPALYWQRGWTLEPPAENASIFWAYHHLSAGISEPIVADVHTDADTRSVLQVGVGHPELLIVSIDSEDGAAVYGGPAYSFYTFHQPMEQRMTDAAWEERVERGDLPDRPHFARQYRAQGPNHRR